MSSQENPNFAHLFGIHSLAAAIVFAVAYVPLSGYFLFQAIRHPTYVFIVLTFFCTVRITGFVIRAILAGLEPAGRDLGLLIGDEVLFGVGFFGLLYSAYTLVLDRWLITDVPPGEDFISKISHNRKVVRILMIVAVALGISAATSQNSNYQLARNFRIISTVIFLILAVFLGYQTILLSRIELSMQDTYRNNGPDEIGHKHGAYVLCVIVLLLLVRELFFTATLGDVAKQNNEHFWYPLSAIPEILAVVLYATPGLVPPRSELPK